MEENIEIPEKFKKLIQEIESLSVIEMVELIRILEKKFGVSAIQHVTTPISSGEVSLADKKEEKTNFNIVLTSPGEKKIEVIKIIKEITSKGLKESKDLVDAAFSSPQIVKENVKKEEAEEIKKRFEEIGAKVELK